MSERFKYALNGVYRIENFAQHLAQNTFPTAQIGTVGGIDGWYIILRTCVIDNQTFVYPFIHCYDKPQLYIHSFFNILGKGGQSFFRSVSSWHLEETLGPRGKSMNILNVLNEKNGYLDNGTLSIEYGFHIDGIEAVDRIWEFNFDDELFNSNESLAIKYDDPEDGLSKVFYCHKQLLCFHSPLFQNQSTKFQTRRHEELLIENCLLISHGVRIPLYTSVIKIACLAHTNKLRNVVHYADQQLVQLWSPKIRHNMPMFLFENSMEFGLRQYLARLVNRFECLKDLKEVIQKLDLEKMSGEAMKTFMAKIFQLST